MSHGVAIIILQVSSQYFLTYCRDIYRIHKKASESERYGCKQSLRTWLTKVSIDTTMNRPSDKELFDKLRQALVAAQNRQVLLIDQDTLAEDAIELGYSIEEELLEVLIELLNETDQGDYAGSRPPQRSYKDEIQDLELFPFSPHSTRFGCRVYLKFAISSGSIWLVSLHKDRPFKE